MIPEAHALKKKVLPVDEGADTDVHMAQAEFSGVQPS